VDGGTLFGVEAGAGPALMLVHGFSLDHRMWEDQLNHFSGSHRVVAVDLRGFGRSSLPSAPYAHHRDMLQLMDTLGIDTAALVGLSMGGRVVIDFAISYPDRVRALVPVDTVLHGFTFQHFSNAAALEVVGRSREEALARWLGHELFEPAMSIPAVAKALHDMVDEFHCWQWLHPNPWQPLNPSSLEQLGKIKAPTLVITGEKDLAEFHTIANLIQSKVEGARSLTIAGAGHMSNMEAPQVFNALLGDFLALHGV